MDGMDVVDRVDTTSQVNLSTSSTRFMPSTISKSAFNLVPNLRMKANWRQASLAAGEGMALCTSSTKSSDLKGFMR